MWSQDTIVCTGESYQAVIKLTFARGASLSDPEHLFNASLEGNTRRAIDLRKSENIIQVAFKQPIRTAIESNAIARLQRSIMTKKKNGG